MFGLNPSQKDAIGLTFALNQLTPDSPYGAEKIKKIVPFERSRAGELAACFDNMEKIISLMNENKSEMGELRFHLMSLKNIRGSIVKCNTHTLNHVDIFEIKNFLLSFEKLETAFKNITATVSLTNICLRPMPEALSVLDPNGQKIAAFTVDSPELQTIREEKLRVETLLQRESNESAKNVLTTQRFLIVQKEDAEESRVLGELSERLREHIPVFLSNLDAIGTLDLTISKASLALKYEAVRPEVNEKEALSFKNMSNPFVADALAKNNQTITKISLTVAKGVTIITGANMGGKSVGLKTTILNIMLCHLGFFVFAEKAEIPLFDDIYLLSEDMQDVERGLSSFGAEILRFNEISARLKSGFMFIALDEFARGTNPEEGASIVRAVASYLSESGSVCVMTTHYDRVVSPQFKHYQVAGLNLPDTDLEAKNALSLIAANMDYTLVEAKHNAAPPHDALTICKLIGLNADILSRIEREYKSVPLT